jgi:hypothetical protein
MRRICRAGFSACAPDGCDCNSPPTSHDRAQAQAEKSIVGPGDSHRHPGASDHNPVLRTRRIGNARAERLPVGSGSRRVGGFDHAFPIVGKTIARSRPVTQVEHLWKLDVGKPTVSGSPAPVPASAGPARPPAIRPNPGSPSRASGRPARPRPTYDFVRQILVTHLVRSFHVGFFLAAKLENKRRRSCEAFSHCS